MRFFDMSLGRDSESGMSRLITINIMQTIGINMGEGMMNDQIKTEHNA